ncbi:hypothetical protein MSG28_000831 [Choristoneura fumiferana]|uniref:Uncharacterized protein n=1 Tax=Choristoneura fumiferana TaxID=7141 RepID=A0ACC0K2M3_CHOFU|nr:hypothetical protein MSG28_000831 [Choristoneura fumiferana]
MAMFRWISSRALSSSASEAAELREPASEPREPGAETSADRAEPASLVRLTASLTGGAIRIKKSLDFSRSDHMDIALSMLMSSSESEHLRSFSHEHCGLVPDEYCSGRQHGSALPKEWRAGGPAGPPGRPPLRRPRRPCSCSGPH